MPKLKKLLPHEEYLSTYEMPLKASKVKVVICGPIEEYGYEPGYNGPYNHELGALVNEYNRTSGKVPYKFKDFRRWKSEGVLMLNTKARDERQIIHFLRHLSLTKLGVVFVFIGEPLQYWPTLLSDSSSESNFFYWFRTCAGSDLFKHINTTRKFLNKEKINWNPV